MQLVSDRIFLTLSSSVYSAYLTLLLTDSAAYALSMIDNSLAVSHGDRRTSQLHAHLTSYALVMVDLKRSIVLYIFKESTWSSGNNYRSLIGCKLFLYSLLALSKVIRVNYSYTLYADSLAELFKIYSSSRVTLKILSCCRILLVACHTCNGVIKDDNC